STNGRKRSRPVVHLAPAVRALPVRTIEPDFVQRAVTREQFGQLCIVDIVVTRRIAVCRMVTIPRREIESCAQTLRTARIDELADQIARTAAPRTRCNRMSRRRGRPETETIVMLRREDHRPEAGGTRRARPLTCIET